YWQTYPYAILISLGLAAVIIIIGSIATISTVKAKKMNNEHMESKTDGNNESSWRPESESSDIIHCIRKHGLNQTLTALQHLNAETIDMLKTMGPLDSLDERFEFDLFC